MIIECNDVYFYILQISHSERTLNLIVQDGSSLEGNSSQSLTSKGKHFDDEDSIITVIESCSFTPRGYSSQDEFRQTKSASLVNHISDEQQKLLQQVNEKSYVSSNPVISNGEIDSSFPQPSVYDCNSTYTLCLGASNSMCNQCLENISNYQLQNSMNSTDSLTRNKSRCAEHNEQYYLYKHAKSVPHNKYYAQFDDMGTNHLQASNIYCSGSCEPSGSSHSNGETRRNSEKASQNSLQKNRQRNFYEVHKNSSTENSLKKGKNWNNRCGEFLCSGNANLSSGQSSESEYRKSVELMPVTSPYKSFEKLNPNNTSAKKLAASNDENLSSLRRDPRESHKKKTSNIIMSMSEENLRILKQRQNDRVFSSSNLYSHLSGPVYEQSLSPSKSSTKSLMRLKDTGKSDLYEKKETQRQNTGKKEKPPLPKHLKTNETKNQRPKTKEKKSEIRKSSSSEKSHKHEGDRNPNLIQRQIPVSNESPKIGHQIIKIKGTKEPTNDNFISSIPENVINKPLPLENNSFNSSKPYITLETSEKDSGVKPSSKKHHSSKSKSSSTNAVNGIDANSHSVKGMNNNHENKTNKSDDNLSEDTSPKIKRSESSDSSKHNKSDFNSNSHKHNSNTELKSVSLIRKIENSKKLKSPKLVTVSNPEVQKLKGDKNNHSQEKLQDNQIQPLKSILRNSK